MAGRRQAAAENEGLTCVKGLCHGSPHAVPRELWQWGTGAGTGLGGSTPHSATQHLLTANHIGAAGQVSASPLSNNTHRFWIAILDHQEKSAALRYVHQQECTGSELCCSQFFPPRFSDWKN